LVVIKGINPDIFPLYNVLSTFKVAVTDLEFPAVMFIFVANVGFVINQSGLLISSGFIELLMVNVPVNAVL